MKRILLTGGSGFIGRNIKESFLVEKYRIIAPSSKDLNLADTDQVDTFFARNKIDIVIHSGAKPGHRNASDHEDLLFLNSRMFFNLTRHAHRYEKMLNIGSGAIYDMRYYQPKMKEEYVGVHIPQDIHGYNKYICNQSISSNSNIIDLRIFGIFGKYEDYAIRFISNAICKALFDLPISLRQDRKFDYLWIDDLMPILDYFIQNDVKYNAYNVTPDMSVSLLQIAHKVKEISQKEVDIIVANDGIGMEYSGCNERLRAEMVGVEFTPLEDAIMNLYRWYEQHKLYIDKQLISIDK